MGAAKQGRRKRSYLGLEFLCGVGTQGPEVSLASQDSWLSQERVSKGCVPEASSRTMYNGTKPRVPNTVPSHQEAQLPVQTQAFPTLGQIRESFCTLYASPRMVVVVSHRFQPVWNLIDSRHRDARRFWPEKVISKISQALFLSRC